MRTHAVLDTSGIKKLEKDLAKLKSSSVDFGYPTAAVHEPSGLTYGHLASILEWGIRGKIPARPALRQTTEELQTSPTAFESVVKGHFARFLTSNSTRFVEPLNRAAGEYLSDYYADLMDDWRTRGDSARNNAPMTIGLKGFNKPFEETGELIANVDYKINS